MEVRVLAVVQAHSSLNYHYLKHFHPLKHLEVLARVQWAMLQRIYIA
jgi:hypothetical protein